jgi:iron complex transport system ATP-binding protein
VQALAVGYPGSSGRATRAAAGSATPARSIVRDLDFQLESGSLVAILGINGSGKTTVMKTMAGFLAPLAGRIDVCGRPLASLSLRERSGFFAYVPQTSQTAWPFSVREVVAAARYSRTGAFRPAGSSDRRAIDAALEAMSLSHLAGRPCTSLSGGEARRVLVARALAQETAFILLDEPCAHLDPGRQIELMESLADLAAAGKGLLVSLHDVNLARRYAKHIVLLMPDGSAVSGSPEEVLVPATLERAYDTEFLFGVHAEYGQYVLPVAARGGVPGTAQGLRGGSGHLATAENPSASHGDHV